VHIAPSARLNGGLINKINDGAENCSWSEAQDSTVTLDLDAWVPYNARGSTEHRNAPHAATVLTAWTRAHR
jgi:hypothetical protein